MKTAIEISDALLREAHRVAAREGVTLDALVERCPDRVVGEKRRAAPFKLRSASFKGKGLHSGLGNASWETIRDLAYENRDW
jgi:hypothetical protein